MNQHETNPDDPAQPPDRTLPPDQTLPPSRTRPRLPIGSGASGWRIEAHLGAGPRSDVYAAIGTLGGVPRRLALKVIHADGGRPAGEAALREAHAASSFRHPHLMHALAVWQQPAGAEPAGAVMLLLPLADFSLADYLRGAGAGLIPEGGLTAFRTGAAGIASALAYLHGRRKADGSGVVLHNDVKPENIFAVDGAWVLGDLGIASGQGSDGASADAGSLSYLAPEYLADPPAGKHPPGDVWALGVTLHRWLTGRFPFPGDTPAERMAALRSGAAPRLDVTGPVLPELIQGMLARDPAGRPSAAAVARRLRGRPSPGPFRRQLSAAVASAVLLLAGVAAGAAGYASLGARMTAFRYASYGTAKSIPAGHQVPIRAQPDRSAAIVGYLADGSPAGIICTEHGDVMHGNWGNTSLWDRVQASVTGFISDGYLYTGTNSAVAPRCPGPGLRR